MFWWFLAYVVQGSKVQTMCVVGPFATPRQALAQRTAWLAVDSTNRATTLWWSGDLR